MTDLSVFAARDVALIRSVFFLQPIVFGAWFPRLAEIQQKIQASEGEFALALIGLTLGLLLTLMFAGRLAEKVGPRQLLVVGLGAFILLMPVPTFMWSVPSLFLALAVIGCALAFVELCMNVIADKVERASGRLIMASCHGGWSLGILTGSLISSGLSWAGYGPSHSLLLVSGAVLLPALFASTALQSGRAPEHVEGENKPFQIPHIALIAVCFFTFGITMTEGAMADWSAIYARDVFDMPAAQAGIAYSVFACWLTVGRLLGDWVRARAPMHMVAAAICCVAILGALLLFFSQSFYLSLLGFGLVGLGVSGGFPLAVTAAAQKPGRSAAANVGFMTQISMAGFLIGPLLIGYTADHVGIQSSLLILIPGLLISLLLTRTLKE